jgi:hypothetical protein
MVLGRPWHGKIRLAFVLALRVDLLDGVPLRVRKEAYAKKEKFKEKSPEEKETGEKRIRKKRDRTER